MYWSRPKPKPLVKQKSPASQTQYAKILGESIEQINNLNL